MFSLWVGFVGSKNTVFYLIIDVKNFIDAVLNGNLYVFNN
jgi:hypothetical protein